MTDMSEAARASGARHGEDPGPLPLAGLKVIDLTLARAGPTAVRHLADWGADVIRVDPPLAPAGTPPTRTWSARSAARTTRTCIATSARLRLNLKDPAGRAVLLDWYGMRTW
jgi:crotonobetainyl-CoA:carnitine CoA-transferase CaiB-like acyl-CoA transferase